MFKFKFNLLVFIVMLLSACVTHKPFKNGDQKVRSENGRQVTRLHNNDKKTKGYRCYNPQRFKGRVIGTGHCVSLIQYCSGAPLTNLWNEGEKVKGSSIQPGSIIATFKSGRYPNKTGWHAAVYISQNEQGIWVWDQWLGKPVHKRLIRFKGGKGTANNDGDAYSVVR